MRQDFWPQEKWEPAKQDQHSINWPVFEHT